MRADFCSESAKFKLSSYLLTDIAGKDPRNRFAEKF
jgi:hypothetical protein